MKAGICLDAWKLPIFERHLQRAGFTYEVGPGVSGDTLTMYVVTDEGRDLVNVVKQANMEAAKTGSP